MKKSLRALFPMLLLSAVVLPLRTRADDTPKKEQDANAPAASPSPTTSPSSAVSASPSPAPPAELAPRHELRKPGFLFLEFGTARVEEYLAYFESVTDFKAVHHQPGYAEMETDRAQVMFMDPAGLPKGHPFYNPPTGSGRGYGMEIGLVVADLDKCYAAALGWKDKGWRISAGIGMRPWGVRDFRVLTPDGYYLRFTEGPKG